MSYIIQHAVVNGLPDVAHRPLWISWSHDFMRAGRVFVGGQDADLTPRHLLFVNVNCLKTENNNESI